MQELLEKIRELILYETVNNSDSHGKEIISHYYKVLAEWINNYNSYRKYSPHFLHTLEKYFDRSLSYSIYIYQNLYEKVIRLPINKIFDQDILDIKPTDSSIENIKKILDKSLPNQKQIRISDFEVKTEGFSDKEIKEMISILVDKLQNDTVQNFQWDIQQVDSTVFDFVFLRALCLRIREPELFYFVTNMFFDRLFTSEYHQDARNLCEEILIASIKDNFSFYGYFICFRVYSNQANVQAALLYGNLFMTAVARQGYLSSNKFQFEIIWQSLKFFRNCHLYPWAIQIYESIPHEISLSDYDRHSLDNSYFTCRLLMKDVSVTTDLDDYLNRERENILSEGINGCIPWLITLYNLKRLDQFFQYSKSGLESYLALFESIVPPKRIEKWKNIVFGNSSELKKQLKESLLKLTRTKNKSDFVYDNEMAIKIASRLIEDSFDKNDFESVLLAMLVKSDFSVNFLNKKSDELEPLDLTEISHESFFEVYDDPVESLKTLPLNDSDFVIFLISSEEKLFYLTFHNNNFAHGQFGDWNFHEFQKWGNEELTQIEFDTTIKDKGGQVRKVFIEDYENESLRVFENLKFPRLDNIPEFRNILLVKDMAISKMPHNLLLDNYGKPLALRGSVTNILSLEWLSIKLKQNSVQYKNDKAIYIPIEGGDLTINMLYESIKETLNDYQIKQTLSITEFQPINSTINIISSHGDREISSTQVIYPNSSSVIHNPDGILAKGKILVFLVCHSGSIKEHFFRNEITSLIKRYLSEGYDAVIAPFWSLHINIPPIWLPIFLKEIDNETEVGRAVFAANKRVFDKYPTPAAWACMHLYGNPFFKISKTTRNER